MAEAEATDSAEVTDNAEATENAEAEAVESERTFSQFVTDGLKSHNEYRKKHGVPELVLNQKLCDFAQEWADQCAKDSKMENREECPYGENIYLFPSTDPNQTATADVAVKAWYDEIEHHTFGTEEINEKTAHFTQVIWKDSKEVGMGVSKNENGDSYIVANYEPKGNLAGQYAENVPPVSVTVTTELTCCC